MESEYLQLILRDQLEYSQYIIASLLLLIIQKTVPKNSQNSSNIKAQLIRPNSDSTLTKPQQTKSRHHRISPKITYIQQMTSSSTFQQPMLFDPKQQNLPYTIAIIKPDTVLQAQKLNEILAFIQESKELQIKNMLQRQLGRQQVRNLFYKHQNKQYFEDLCQYMRSGECCVLVLVNADKTEGDPILKWRDMVGPSSPQEAKKTKPNSLRAKYATSLIKNQFHASDNIIEANKQRKIFNFRVPQKAPEFVDDPFKITFKSIQQFLQPPNLQHSCVNQRMDILAFYGPIVNWHSIEQCFCAKCRVLSREQSEKVKSTSKQNIVKNLKQGHIRNIFNDLCQKCQQHCEGFSHLAGGRMMQHLLTDNQIKELVQQLNKKQLIEMLTIEKGSTAKVMIEKIEIREPKQVQYDMDFFKILLQEIDTDYYDRYSFTELQNLILEDRRIRLSYWVSKIVGKSIDRFPSVTALDNTLTLEQLKDPKSPFFTLSRKLPLTLLIKPQQIKNVPILFPPSIMDKQKLYHMQQNLVIQKSLHRNLTKVISIGQKSKGFKEAVTLLRPYNQGRHGDWDNYSSLKGNGDKSIVGGKNMASYVDN